MDHWEYLAIKFESNHKWKDSSGRSGKLDRDDYNHGYTNLADLLNQRGAEGWELIMNNPFSMGSGFGTLVFKRHKAITP